MADVHSKGIRSKNMAAIKGRNTKPEMPMRRFLHLDNRRLIPEFPQILSEQ
jgi:DNA mismatch endonuclease (patch repair protein)